MANGLRMSKPLKVEDWEWMMTECISPNPSRCHVLSVQYSMPATWYSLCILRI